MEAEIKIAEVLLEQARVLKRSKDPKETIAAAKWEIRLAEELEALKRKQQRGRQAKPVPGGG